MKKAIFLLMSIGIVFSSSGQVSFGPIVGVGIQGASSYSNNNLSVYNTSNVTKVVTTDQNGNIVNSATTTSGGGYNASNNHYPAPVPGVSYKFGVQAKINLHTYFAITTAVAYQRMSSSQDISALTNRQFTNNYISVPVLVQVQYPINNKVTIGLGVGPEFNFFMGGKDVYSGGGNNYTANIKVNSDVNSVPSANNTDEYNRLLNVVLNIAPFVQLNFSKVKLVITPTYYLGLSNIATPYKYSVTYITTTSQKVPSGLVNTTTTTNTNTNASYVDIKDVIKTSGFGLNVALLFGGNKK